MLKFSYCWITNFAINPCSSGKFLDYGKYACVKDLTNIMSVKISLTNFETSLTDSEIGLILSSGLTSIGLAGLF